MGCKKQNTNFEANIIKETITNTDATIDVVINEDKINIEALNELANTVANSVYIDNFDDFKDKEMILTINVYKDINDFNDDTKTYGQLIFHINQSEDNPGLSIKKNDLKSK